MSIQRTTNKTFVCDGCENEFPLGPSDPSVMNAHGTSDHLCLLCWDERLSLSGGDEQ